jgi:hypothetical protein
MIECDQVALYRASTLHEILGKPRRRRSGPAFGKQSAQVALDMHAIEFPAMIKIPGRLQTGLRIV